MPYCRASLSSLTSARASLANNAAAKARATNETLKRRISILPQIVSVLMIWPRTGARLAHPRFSVDSQGYCRRGAAQVLFLCAVRLLFDRKTCPIGQKFRNGDRPLSLLA